jgi:hypothetical protein
MCSDVKKLEASPRDTADVEQIWAMVNVVDELAH